MALNLYQLASICLVLAGFTSSATNPHIVYILIDDLGHANVEFNNYRQQTPNIDKLLPESLLLNNFYTYKFCSPTRTALMTGRLPYHVNEINGPVCSQGFGIPVNMTTISERLVNDAGYEAHQLGKWHMGMASMINAPAGKAFKSSLGYFHADEDHFTQNYTEKPIDNVTCSGVDLWFTDKPADGKNGTYGDIIYSDRAQKLINAYNSSTGNNKPLFMYLATQVCHGPIEAPQSYIDKFNASWNQAQRTYAAMANFADEVVGNVTRALKETNMWDSTLLFITSDNGGPVGAANNSPLRGGKFSNFQGGVNVIGMISGGYLPKHRRGTRLNGTIHIADWYATICSIVGLDPTDTRAEQAGLPPIDSINMWPWIMNEENDMVSPRNEFVLSSLDERNGGGGLIMGDYKMLFGEQDPAFWTTLDFPNGTTPEPQSINCGNLTAGGCLFNIKEDPTEHFDIVNKSENKALREEMRQRYIELLNTTYTPNTGDTDPKCCEQIKTNGGYWGPWINMTDYYK